MTFDDSKPQPDTEQADTQPAPTGYCSRCTVVEVVAPATMCDTCSEAERTSEVAEVLGRAGVTRDEVENKAEQTPGANESRSLMDLITSKQLAMIRMLGTTKSINVDIECRKTMQCEVAELAQHAANVFIRHLQDIPLMKAAGATASAPIPPPAGSDVERSKEAFRHAETNTEAAAKSVHAELVPEMGVVLAKHEPGALTYGFPPAVEALVEKVKLDDAQARALLAKFRELFIMTDSWRNRVDAIEITSVDDKIAIAEAKDLHKAIQTERLNAEKRKTLVKAPYLKPGQLIDGVFKVWMDEITPIERAALAKAKYAENLEIERKEKIRLQRVEQLTPFVENIAAFNLHPDSMTDEAFDTVLSTQKELHQVREAEAKRFAAEEQTRLDNEAAERVKIRRQNERVSELSGLGFTRDNGNNRYALGDLMVYQQDLENENPETWTSRIAGLTPLAEDIRREQKRIADEGTAALSKKSSEKLEAERKQLAPDKEKLEMLAEAIEAIEMPTVVNDATISILGEIKGDLYNTATKLRNRLKQLP